MKKQFNVLTLLVTCVLCFVACTNSSKTVTESSPTETESSYNNNAGVEGDTVANSFCDFSPSHPGFITMQQFLTDAARYDSVIRTTVRNNFAQRGMQAELRGQMLQKEPVQMVSFSLQRLKSFIYHIDTLAASLEYPEREKLAITWTYAVYDNDEARTLREANGQVIADKRNLHTLYAVPSVRTDDGYELLDLHDLSSFYDRAKMEAQNNFASASSGGVALAPDEAAFNLGQLCPPFCDPDQQTLVDLIESLEVGY